MLGSGCFANCWRKDFDNLVSSGRFSVLTRLMFRMNFKTPISEEQTFFFKLVYEICQGLPCVHVALYRMYFLPLLSKRSIDPPCGEGRGRLKPPFEGEWGFRVTLN